MAEIIQKTDKKTIYREGKTLVKLFNSSYPKSDVLNEALNTARVEEGTSLNVPAVHEVTKVNGEWAIILDYVEGKTLQQLMDDLVARLLAVFQQIGHHADVLGHIDAHKGRGLLILGHTAHGLSYFCKIHKQLKGRHYQDCHHTYDDIGLCDHECTDLNGTAEPVLNGEGNRSVYKPDGLCQNPA